MSGRARANRTLALALAGAAAGAAIRVAFRSDLRAAHARLAGQSRLVATACGPVELGVAGTGPPVLVIHGTAGGFDMGLRLGSDALGEDFRILAPSRFGYLRTPMPANASHADQADALAALLDALDFSRVAVVGVSAGAQSATQLALRHPERVQALVLVSPALYLPSKPGSRPEPGPPAFVFDHLLASDFLAWAMVRLAPKALVRVAGVPRSLDTKVTPEIRRHLADWFLPASARAVGLAHDIRTATPRAPDLPIEQLQMPVMLIAATDDPYKTGEIVRYSATRLPTAEVVVLESGGHILLGQDARVRQEVRAFLRAHLARAEPAIR